MIIFNECNVFALIKISEDDPGFISWNVIMRPVIQDTIFPVLATVCGPGEVSYFAQISGVYDLMDVKLPVIYPRFSATIIEKNIGKIERSKSEIFLGSSASM